MKIVQIIPGVGDTFYCQNCMRDRELVLELRSRGHDVVLAPMYLPVFSEGEDISGDVPVFFGAVGVYLGQYLPAVSGAPGWLKRLIDSRGLLGWIARKAGTTSARGLEKMTLSVLQGESGGQKVELERLVEWLESEGKPDIVHLSNALLIGLAGRIRAALGVPVLCALQDEDSWINSMAPEAARSAWTLMGEKAKHVAAFTPVSRYYSEVMQKYLGTDAGKFHVVPTGIRTDGYEPADGAPAVPVIGYLSRMSESLGLGILVDAFMILRRSGRFPGLRLKVMGGRTTDDGPFLRGLQRKLQAAKLDGDVEFFERFARADRIAFLQSLSVLSVPMPKPESAGIFLLESIACGVPVVQPRGGAFPEIIEATGGGICYDGNDPATVAEALGLLLADPARAARMGRQGRQVVLSEFSVQKTAAKLLDVYGEFI